MNLRLIVISATILATMLPGKRCHGEGSEIWADTRFAVRWTDDLTLFGATGLRWDDAASSLTRFSAQAGFDIRTTSYLTLSPSFQIITDELDGETRSDEYRLGLTMATSRKWDDFLLRASARVEYRSRDDGQSDWRFRPSVGIQHPIGPKQWGLGVYSTIEGFISFESGDWVRTRAFAGFRKTIYKDCDMELYLGREWNDGYGNGTENIVGLALRFAFDRPKQLKPMVEGLMDSPE